jgi:serine/threonine protein kinase
VDANIAERLTASPRVYDIYGHCGIGIMSEWFPYGDLEEMSIDYDDYPSIDDIQKDMEQQDLVVYNRLSSRDKLRAALHMAEALADLHGYQNGVIVHQDIQLSQFLLTKDKTRIKLNDFNRAEFMLWDDHAQEYCQYNSGGAHGNVSSLSLQLRATHHQKMLLTKNFLFPLFW